MIYFPDVTWPAAFWILAIVITGLMILIYFARIDIRENNKIVALKIKSNEILSQLLQESTRREEATRQRELKLIKILDNFVVQHEALYECMKSAPDGASRAECVRKFRDDIEFSDGMDFNE